MRRAMDNLGYTTISTAATGEDAVSDALALHPDVILMDIMLAGPLDGIRAAEKILEQTDIPVVYVTAYTDEATLARAKVTEPFGFVTKPFEERELQAAIAIALYKHRLEQRLRNSEQRFRLLFHHAPVGIAYYGTDYRVLDVNERFARFLGQPVNELVRSDIRVVLGGEMIDAVSAPMSGTTGSFEGPIRLPPPRSSARVVLRTAPVGGPTQPASGAIALLEDVTDRYGVEEELVRLVAIESFIAGCSAEFIGLTAVDLASHFSRVLERTGRFIGADRAVLHLFENRSTVLREVHEWRAESLAPLVEDYRGKDLRDFRWLLKRCEEGEPLCILRTSDIPAEGAAERDFWLSQGIRSMLCMPLSLHGSPLGYLAVTAEQENRSWTGENIRLLRLLAQNFVSFFARRQAEEGWEESDERFQILVGGLEEVIFAVDGRGFFTFVSKGMERLSGYGSEEILGEHLTRFVHPHDREEVEETWDRAAEGLTGTLEFRLLTKGGDVRDLRASIHAVTLGNELAGMTGILVDISDRKRAETALQESEERYRRLWEDSSDGLVLVDAISGAVIDCNAEFCRQTGRAKEALQSLHIWDIRPAELQEAARRKFLEIAEAGGGGSSELDFQRPDGSRVRVDFLSRLLAIGGREVIQSRCRQISPKP
jgi:PAS domain S-box-containing protein